MEVSDAEEEDDDIVLYLVDDSQKPDSLALESAEIIDNLENPSRFLARPELAPTTKRKMSDKVKNNDARSLLSRHRSSLETLSPSLEETKCRSLSSWTDEGALVDENVSDDKFCSA